MRGWRAQPWLAVFMNKGGLTITAHGHSGLCSLVFYAWVARFETLVVTEGEVHGTL